MSKISHFTKKTVRLAKNAVGGRGEVAAPEGGGGFADYAVVTLHCLRVYLEKSYREALDLLSEMPQILGEIGLTAADLPHHSTLVKAFDRIKMAIGTRCDRFDVFRPREREYTLLPPDELPRPDTENDSPR